MNDRRRWIPLGVALVASLADCAVPPEERFYTLSDALPPAAGAKTGSPYRVAIGPVTVPEGVDRPQMVVRMSGHRVELSELYRWAEPLKSEIPRVLAANLRRDLGIEQIATLDAGASLDWDYRIRVDVQRFEGTLGSGVAVEALWSVRANDGGPPRTGRSAVREPALGADHEALARAYGRALARVAGELAAALRALRATQP